jgi:RNA recognition motif-containing protein
LVVENLTEDVSKLQLEMIFNEAAVEEEVHNHEEINVIQAFGTAYVKYPNVESAKKVVTIFTPPFPKRSYST